MTESVIWLHKAIFTDSRKQQDITGALLCSALLCCQCIAGDSPLSTPVSGKPANLLTTAKQQFLTGNWLTRWVPIALRRRLAPGLPMNFYKKVYHRNKSLPRLFWKKVEKCFETANRGEWYTIVRPAFPVPGQTVGCALGKGEIFFGFAWHCCLLPFLSIKTAGNRFIVARRGMYCDAKYCISVKFMIH